MKSTSDLFNEIIPLGRLIHMVNQKKDRLLNEYLSPLDITAAQFKVLALFTSIKSLQQLVDNVTTSLRQS